MKLDILVLVCFFFVSGRGDSECCCSEERCPICRDVDCKCEVFGCGDDEKMSLRKLILHFLQRAQRKTEDDEPEDDTITPLVRVLRDILKRASRLNINEEIAIRDMILCRLRTLETKCPCLDLPHETSTKAFLRLLLEKCLVCDCGIVPCECVWRKKTCEPPTGMYWFKTTDENLRKERPKRECKRKGEEKKCWQEVREEQRRGQRVSKTCSADSDRGCSDFDNSYKCRRMYEDETEVNCNQFSICTDCDNCQMVTLKGKDEILLLCDDCKVMNSPYVQFTKGGCPVKANSLEGKRLIKIRTRYLQLNDFRPQQLKNKCDRSDFECPSLSKLEQKKGRRHKCG